MTDNEEGAGALLFVLGLGLGLSGTWLMFGWPGLLIVAGAVLFWMSLRIGQ